MHPAGLVVVALLGIQSVTGQFPSNNTGVTFQVTFDGQNGPGLTGVIGVPASVGNAAGFGASTQSPFPAINAQSPVTQFFSGTTGGNPVPIGNQGGFGASTQSPLPFPAINAQSPVTQFFPGTTGGNPVPIGNQGGFGASTQSPLPFPAINAQSPVTQFFPGTTGGNPVPIGNQGGFGASTQSPLPFPAINAQSPVTQFFPGTTGGNPVPIGNQGGFGASTQSPLPFPAINAQSPVTQFFSGTGTSPTSLLSGEISDNESQLELEWINFKFQYNKTYNSPADEYFRRQIFIDTRNTIVKFNNGFLRGQASFSMGLNAYGDSLQNEFHNAVNGFNRIRGRRNAKVLRRGEYFVPRNDISIPASIDWRDYGAVTSVKEQGMCSGCYAFSAAGALEGQYFLRKGKLVDVSPQNIIDCTDSPTYGNDKCFGGTTDSSFRYVSDNKGVDKESAYPFEGVGRQCRYRREGRGAYDKGYRSIREGNERDLEQAVATIGPISVAMDSLLNTFKNYKEGIYYDPECRSDAPSMNHAVLVVGYGSEPSGEQYWLVKNSYGPSWGMGGYFKLPKFRNNHCGIATSAFYPVL